MHALTRMTKKRNQWRDKARQRAESLREARKLQNRQKKKIEELNEKVAALSSALSEEIGAEKK